MESSWQFLIQVLGLYTMIFVNSYFQIVFFQFRTPIGHTTVFGFHLDHGECKGFK